MKCLSLAVLGLLVFLLLAQPVLANYAFDLGDYNLKVLNGYTFKVGDDWISTTGTDITVSAWLESNWLNYTVDSSGTQQFYNGTKPTNIILAGVDKEEGNGWSFSAQGVLSVTGATSTVSIKWGGVPVTTGGGGGGGEEEPEPEPEPEPETPPNDDTGGSTSPTDGGGGNEIPIPKTVTGNALITFGLLSLFLSLGVVTVAGIIRGIFGKKKVARTS